MTDKEFTLDTMRRYGRQRALDVQTESATMTNTELNAQDDYIPDFLAAKEKMNMLERHAGLTDGFVCKSSEGRVVRLLQNYDSDVFTGDLKHFLLSGALCGAKTQQRQNLSLLYLHLHI